MAAKFKIIPSKNGEFHFTLQADNNKIIATGGENYKTKNSCHGGIESVKKCAHKAEIEDTTADNHEKQKCPKFEIYEDKGGEFRFRLLASNGEPIAASEGYKSKASCINGIESVKENAADAPIEEE